MPQAILMLLGPTVWQWGQELTIFLISRPMDTNMQMNRNSPPIFHRRFQGFLVALPVTSLVFQRRNLRQPLAPSIHLLLAILPGQAFQHPTLKTLAPANN